MAGAKAAAIGDGAMAADMVKVNVFPAFAVAAEVREMPTAFPSQGRWLMGIGRSAALTPERTGKSVSRAFNDHRTQSIDNRI